MYAHLGSVAQAIQALDKRTLATRLRVRFRLTLVAVCLLLRTAALFGATASAQTCAAGIKGNPTSIASGGSSTLTWTTTNCVSADLNGTPVPTGAGSRVV